MKNKHSVIFTLIAFLLITVSITLAEGIKEKPIARVFDKEIFYSDINQDGRLSKIYLSKMNTADRIEWIKKKELETLEFVILSELKNKFLIDTGSEPTAQEFTQFVNFSIQEQANRSQKHLTQRNQILNQLQLDDLTDTKKSSLNEQLKSLNLLIENDIARRKDTLNPDYVENQKKSFQAIANQFVTEWKFNQALYYKYGGRVIFQQAGYESIDAYKTFLEHHIQAKSFEIYDPQYEKVFVQMFAYFEMGHNYLDKQTADKYFAKPWWDPTFEPM